MTDTPWFDRRENGLLWKRVESFLAGYRQNVALIGAESVGKTTLLKHLLQRKAMTVPSLLPFYIEVRGEETVSEWCARFIQLLMYGMLQCGRATFLPSDLSDLLRLCADRVPNSVALVSRILEAAERGRDEEAFDRLWDLPQMVSQEAGVSCLLVLDEFQLLRQFPIKDPFGCLGRHIMVQSTMYILASSQPAQARSILREGLNLLFGQFEIIEMEPLHPAACREAFRSACPGHGKDPLLEHLLLELVQGYPGYLDLLLQGLSRSRLAETADKERVVLDMLEALLLDPQGALRARCEQRLRVLPAHRNRRAWIQVLMAASAGSHRVPQIAAAIGRSHSQVLSALSVLEEAGLVSKQGAFYRIPDRFFELWMLAAYPVFQGMDQIDPAYTRARFRDAAWSWIAKVYEGGHRSIEDQIRALAALWDGDLVEIDGHRIVLPRFHEIRVENRSGAATFLRAVRAEHGSPGPDWIIVPWSGRLEESQARSLASGLSASSWKECRKLLFGAYPVDINARLVLHEAKIRFWDLHALNNLLDLYGLPRIPFPEGGDSAEETMRIPLPAAEQRRAPDASAVERA